MVVLLALLAVQLGELEFTPDYAFFKEANALTYTEVYYKISYRELSYTGDDALTATIGFSFRCTNLTTGDSLVDGWERRSVISSVGEAQVCRPFGFAHDTSAGYRCVLGRSRNRPFEDVQ